MVLTRAQLPADAYDAIAERYTELLATDGVPHDTAIPVLLDLLGPLAGRRVLDLACGTGRLSRRLAEAGADAVVAVDLSRELLRHAVDTEWQQPRAITYLHDDAQTLGSVGDASLDAVACCLALADIADLDAVYRAVWRVLRSGGVFAWVVNHPAAPVSGGNGKLHPLPIPYHEATCWRSGNPESVRSLVPTWHRPLAAYVNRALAVGFVLAPPAPLREVPAPPQVLARHPLYRHLPYLLAVRLQKCSTAGASSHGGSYTHEEAP